MSSALNPGESLGINDSRTSPSGQLVFTLQSDGNLVLYADPELTQPLWGANVAGGKVCIMQGDGNLVIYDSAANPIWASNTGGNPGSRLLVQDDGNVVIYKPDNKPIWATNTLVPHVYTIQHVYVDKEVVLRTKLDANKNKTITFSSLGNIAIRHPGPFRIFISASYHVSKWVSGRWVSSGGIKIPITFKIYSPDGKEFTSSQVTLDDLNRFRDLHGISQGTWRYAAHGDSGPIDIEDPGEDERIMVTPNPGYLRIAIDEILPSRSAGPLLEREITSLGAEVYSFDLYRVGQFEAKVSSSFFDRWNGRLDLRDPDGVIVASTEGAGLRFPISVRTLEQSRGPAGEIRQWSLAVRTTKLGSGSKIRATVVTSMRIPVSIVQDRINDLIGTNGSKVRIYGENKDGRALGRIEILDEFSAATMDMYHLLDKVIGNVKQDTGVKTSEVKEHVVYNFVNTNESLGKGLSIDISSFKVKTINITLGASQHIQPVVPSVTVKLNVEGVVDLYWSGIPAGTVSANNNSVSLEAGAKLNDSGDIDTLSWIRDPLNFDISADVWLIVGPLTGFADVELFRVYIQSVVNNRIVAKFQSIIEGAIFEFRRIMVVLLGANFTLTSLYMDGDFIVIDYISPLEPEPKPNKLYTPVIGRSVEQVVGHGGWNIQPPSLGDTWAADSLKSKIQHIVVVMMENRSFDHVLGYRAALSGAQNENGLTSKLIQFLGEKGFPILPLRAVDNIPENSAHLKTRFPLSVGHRFTDVATQLSQRLKTESDVIINSPQGFVDNFKQKHPPSEPPNPSDLDRNAVLGYYFDADLRISAFLAHTYAYSQLYFSSHPGPTLPNRMYWLTGDLQYDRTGEAIIENNDSDNFLLSRALTIFDILERKNVSWRVYESFPSIATLRMFARYAGDKTNIVDIKNLEADIAAGNLPAVTFIEPAMHHQPENDDHPIADMFLGQHFIKRVYDALTSNKEIWRNTLLIITYDEHGGFYDHVVPPIADLYSQGVSLNIHPQILDTNAPPEPHAPDTKIDSAIDGNGNTVTNGGITSSDSIIFNFSGEPAADTDHFRCYLDGNPFPSPNDPCVSGKLITGLSHGKHTFMVKAVAKDGTEDISWSTFTWNTQKNFKEDMIVPYGVRVPTFVVSPWVSAGKGPEMVLDHCSIIKTILARFCGNDRPFLNDRIHWSHSFESFLTESEPRVNPIPSSPILPSPFMPGRTLDRTRAIITKPVTRRAMDVGEADFHEITGMLARMLGRR